MVYNIIETENYKFRAEVDEYFNVCLHMDVYNWTPRVAKEIRRVYKTAREAFYLEGFNVLYTVTQKPKFIELVAPDLKFIKEGTTEVGYVSVYVDKLEDLTWGQV